MDSKTFQDWLIPVSSSVTLVSVAIAVLVGICEYRLKLRAEERLRESTRSEVDVRLSKLFAELMWLAHARAGSHVSEKCVEELFEKEMITKEDFNDPGSLNRKLEAACIFNLPVGQASQDAAIGSIAVLGRRYEILYEPAKAALNSLRSFKRKEAEEALALLGKQS